MANEVYQIWERVPFKDDILYNKEIYEDRDEAQGICDKSTWPAPELYIKVLKFNPSKRASEGFEPLNV